MPARGLQHAVTQGAQAPLVDRLGPWLRRYAPLELAGWLGSLAAASAAWGCAPRLELFVLAAVAGELAGFYGAAFAREWFGGAHAESILRRLVGELALAETLDTLLLRPLSIAAASALGPPPVLAILLGGGIADLCFYSLAACSARRRSARTQSPRD